jgi:hypothetical protein
VFWGREGKVTIISRLETPFSDEKKEVVQIDSFKFDTDEVIKILKRMFPRVSSFGKLNIVSSVFPVKEISKSELKKALKTIKNMDDLDIWRMNHPLIEPELNQFGDLNPSAGENYVMSRYDALVLIYGEKQADKMMRELEVRSWDKPKNYK